MNYIILIFGENNINQNEKWGDILEISSDQGSYKKLSKQPIQDTTIQQLLDHLKDNECWDQNEIDKVCEKLRNTISNNLSIEIEAIGIVETGLDGAGDDFRKTNIIWSNNSNIPNSLEDDFNVQYE